MAKKFLLAIFFGLLLCSCAQVPREAVELSDTVGRDIAVVHQSHRELAQILFTRMRNDVNRFIDNVYAPYQIDKVMSRQQELSLSSSDEDRNKSILLLIDAAFKPEAPPELQNTALRAMDILIKKIHADIESKRQELLDPLNAQEDEVLGSIDRAYQQLHYANSIVTGHLSSIVKVHEAQAELLQSIGVERDLRKVVSEGLAETSDKIGSLVEAAENVDNKIGVAEGNADSLKNAIMELGDKLKK